MEVQQNRLIQKADTVMWMRIKCGFELPDSQSRKENGGWQFYLWEHETSLTTALTGTCVRQPPHPKL